MLAGFFTSTLRLLSLTIATLLALGGLFSLAPAAGAQREESPFELDSGVAIAFDRSWELDDSELFEVEGQDIERVLFLNGDYAFIVNEVTPYSGTVEGQRDSAVDAIQNGELWDTFDQRDSASASMTLEGSLVNGEFDPEEGESDWFYHVFDVDQDYRIEIRVWSPIGEMGDAFEEIQDGIEIDGEVPFADVDTDEVVDSFESSNATSDDGDEDDETPVADDDEYLKTVQDQYDDWSAAYDRFLEILNDEDLGDDEIAAEFREILATFEDAPDVAAELDAPREFEEIQDAYEAYADSLANISITLEDFLATEEDSPEEEEALAAFNDAIDEAADLGAELEDLLGADSDDGFITIDRAA